MTRQAISPGALVTLSVSDGIATLRLNKPDRLNALCPTMAGELAAALYEVKLRKDVRALMLVGEGRAFCAGADLSAGSIKDTKQSPGELVTQALTAHFNPLIEQLQAAPIPTLACVNGVIAGGGIGLALACDVVIAADAADFAFVFLPQLGLIPDMGCTWFLTRALGQARARSIMMSGARLSAVSAAEMGLIDRAVPPEDLAAEAHTMATRLAKGPTHAYPALRSAISAASSNDLPSQLALETRLQADLANTRDHAEGLRAFMEKRAPDFTGR